MTQDKQITQPAVHLPVDFDTLVPVISTLVGELHPKWKHIRFLPDSHLELDLGLDSMARLELRTRIEQQLGVKLAENQAIISSTAADLLNAINAGADSAGLPAMEPARRRPPEQEVDMLLGARNLVPVSHPPVRGHSLKEWLYALYAWPVFATLSVLTWVLMVFNPVERWRRLVAHAGATLLFKATFTPLLVRGHEHLEPGKPYVLVANHASYLDGFVITAALRIQFHIVVKGELSRTLPARLILQRFGVEFVERFNPSRSARDVLRIAKKVKSGCPLVFFPEGTFVRFPGLQAFRMGAFVTAARSNVPVVPIIIKGTRSILRGYDRLPNKGNIEVIIRPPINPAGESWHDALQLRDATRREIRAYCGEPDLIHERAAE